MAIHLDQSILSGYTKAPSRYNADGTPSNANAFRDNLIAMMREADGMTEQEAAISNSKKMKAKADPDNRYDTLCFYGPCSTEELLLEYDFIPAWQGVPAEPDPFTSYYDFVDGKDEGYVNAYHPTTIPIYSGNVKQTIYGDGRIVTSGDVVGYFVKKGSLAANAEFSVVKIAMQGTSMTVEEMLNSALKSLMHLCGDEKDGEGNQNSQI